ncbi:hypothetical protein VB713_08105 [Anabaena cylindrica UHCC 0172]|uniref:hypothetical protein n=1 Tax=Anabaena cylindrica TaxID=1165 RepID=UPI002B1EA463|nr:hypothetical protein [Anabaena cylindrica]MEA5550939.1 hypothetical protein [Anabaena cylindrica UHCC 0172]
MTIATFGIAVLPPGSETIIQALKVSKQVIGTAYSSYLAFESDQSILGVLNVVQGVANIIATVNPALISSANGLFDPVRLLLTAGQIANPTYFAIQTIENGDILGGLSYLGQIATVISHNFGNELSNLSRTGLGQVFNEIPLDQFLNIFETVSVISNAIASDDIATWISAVTSGLNIWDDELRDFVNNHLNNCECEPNTHPVEDSETTNINDNSPDPSEDLLNSDGSNLTDNEITGNNSDGHITDDNSEQPPVNSDNSNSDSSVTSPSDTTSSNNSSADNNQNSNTGNQNLDLQEQPLNQYYYDSQGNLIPISETNGLDANGNIITNPETNIFFITKDPEGKVISISGIITKPNNDNGVNQDSSSIYQDWLEEYIDSIAADIVSIDNIAENIVEFYGYPDSLQLTDVPGAYWSGKTAALEEYFKKLLKKNGDELADSIGILGKTNKLIGVAIQLASEDYYSKEKGFNWGRFTFDFGAGEGIALGGTAIGTEIVELLIVAGVTVEIGGAALIIGGVILGGSLLWSSVDDNIYHWLERNIDYLVNNSILINNSDEIFWTKEKREEFFLNSNSGLLERIDPVILDLNNDGIKLISLDDSNIFFDMDGDGYTENTGWVSAKDGILTVDINLDGTINSIEEIFSEKFGGNKFNSGLQALATFDSNKDSIISSQDTRFSEILIWQDLNQNGISESNELSNLESAGITSINLQNITVNTEYEGNKILRVSSYTNSNGNLGLLGDAGLLVEKLGILTNNLDGIIQIQLENLANSLVTVQGVEKR